MSRFLFATLIMASLAYAQSGQIQIDVKDSSGAPMRAGGTLSRLSGGVAQGFETDAQGHFTFSNLEMSRYRLVVTADGFASQAVLIEVVSEMPILHAVTLTVGVDTTRVDVVAATPLPGVDLSLDQIAAPVQALNERAILQSGALNLSDVLNKRLNGVFLNEVQGNPFQADLNYRGYTASPLLGTPQGISIYMDGVRLNQPFGDVVSWDLIPRIAIAETALIPGSDPLFGLNTLGGALSIRTKDGYTNPHNVLQIAGGNFLRKTADFEHGGSKGGLNWYTASNLFFEEGWRNSSPSNVRQFLGKAGWSGAKTTLGVMAIYSNNQLNGGGVQEQRLLAKDYASLYTKPDVSTNRSPFFNFTGRHEVNEKLTFFGNAYYRYISSGTFNADINEESLDQSLYQPGAAERAALLVAGYGVVPASGLNATNTPFPSLRCIANGLIRDEPAEKCNGLVNRTNSRQHNTGFSGQITWVTSPGNNRSQFTAGAAWDRSGTVFQLNSQLGYLNPDRSVTPIQAFGDGVTGGNTDGEPYDTRVDLHGTIRTGSVYATDTFSFGKMWNATVAGRYNRTAIHNRDLIRPGGVAGSLDGQYVFERLNPAFGLTFNPMQWLNTYVRYSEASRAPTSIELGCADPEVPCKLPNAMAGDPPLEQVVAKTWEAGYRGGLEGRMNWSAGWYRAENRNDILFVSAPQTGFGYFKNFGKTRRQGLEADFDTHIKRVSFGFNYTFLDATFQSPEEINGTGNSTNSDALAGRKGLESVIDIAPGNRVPLAPRHMGKAFADIQATRKFSLNLNMLAFSSSYARGNENNRHVADGTYYLGPGKSGGYAVFNLGGRYQVSKRFQLFAQMNNVLDRHYSSAAQLGPTGFSADGNFIARPFAAINGVFPVAQGTFFAPGAPRTVWGGARIQF
ncbi:MAG: TonB-dependent receptor [Acidobacteriota bacterium]